jgi:hypothetical protein
MSQRGETETLMGIAEILPDASRTDRARNEQTSVREEFTALEIDFFARAAELYSTDDSAEDAVGPART